MSVAPSAPSFLVNEIPPDIPSAVLVGHKGPIQAIQWADDGKYCVTGGHDRTVRLWNPFRLDPAYAPSSYDSDADVVSSQTITATTAAAAMNHHKRQRRSSPTAKQRQLPHALPIQTYANGYTYPICAITTTGISSSSSSSATSYNTSSSAAAVTNNNNHNNSNGNEKQLLLAASDRTLVITDLVTTQIIRRLTNIHAGKINDVSTALSAGTTHKNSNSHYYGPEAYLTASYDGTVAIWDGRNNRSFRPIQVLKDATDSVTSICVEQNPAEQIGIIRTSSIDGVIRTYDVRMGILKNDDVHVPITAMTPTHDNRRLAISTVNLSNRSTSSNSTSTSKYDTPKNRNNKNSNKKKNNANILLLETETGKVVNTYYGGHSNHTGYPIGIDVMANDQYIATGSETGECVLYDILHHQPQKNNEHNSNNNVVLRLNAGANIQYDDKSGVVTYTTETSTTDNATFIDTSNNDTDNNNDNNNGDIASLVSDMRKNKTRPTCSIAAHPYQSSTILTTNYGHEVVTVWTSAKKV